MKEKDKQRKAKESKEKGWINSFNWKILQVTCCMCDFMVHEFVYLVDLLSLAWDLLSLIAVSALPFRFLVSHGVMGFILG